MSHLVPKAPGVYTLQVAMKENPELKMSDIEMLREWCEKQAHLPKISDLLLALFLHSNYYRIEPAKSTIENYFTVRTHVPDFFSGRDPLGDRGIRHIMNVTLIIPLPGKSHTNQKVCFAKLVDTDASKYVFVDNIKLLCMIVDMWCYQFGFAKGQIFVADAAGLSLGHVARLTPLGVKRFVYYIQEAMPIRLTAIHVLNAPTAAELILNMARPFMKKELLDMIHFHSDAKPLDEIISKDYIPKEYGGKSESIRDTFERSKKELEDNRDYFLEEQVWGRVNESLRVGKNNAANDLFGVEGSFKKLDID